MLRKIVEIYNYRQMIFGLVHRELRGRYKGSVLGFLWTFLNPLLQLCVYTLLFSVILDRGVENYPVFLFIGLVPWLFFSSCLSAGCTSVLGQGPMVTKIYFPREVLPISFVVGAFVNMLYCFVVLFGILVVTGFGFNFLALLLLPVIMVVEFLLCLGFTLIFSAVTVYVRDLAHFLGIITMLWQFLTPIMYETPEKYRHLFNLNPMTSVIECYKAVLYYKQIPDISSLWSAVLIGVFSVVIGEFIFSKLQKGFAEEL